MTDWLTAAKRIAVARKLRLDCECGSGKTLIVNHNPQGYSCFCYRCDYSEFVGKGKQTLEELANIRALNEAAANERYDIKLPDDFTTDIPLEGRLWLYKAGVTVSLWSSYNFGWSERMQRVVMPVYRGKELVWFQARAVLHGQTPKYLNPTGDRTSLVFWAGCSKDYSDVTVVEDILSAIRVGVVTPTCSLLGTKVTVQQALQLSRYERVSSWLDADAAGVGGSYKLRKLLGMVTEVRDIRTTKDPKAYSNAEIRSVLCTQ